MATRQIKYRNHLLKANTVVANSAWVNMGENDGGEITLHVAGLAVGDIVKLQGSNEQVPLEANVVQIDEDIVENAIYQVPVPPAWLRVRRSANAGAGTVNAILHIR